MLKGEQMLNLKDAADLVPSRPHFSALWRWCRRGVLARNGRRVYLEHRRYGSRLFTTAEALDRFGAELAEADTHAADGTRASPTRSTAKPDGPRGEAVRQAEVERARQRLRDEGF